MTAPFLLPQDVRTEHAQQVLDFINAAPNAKTIAEAVEFPNELDVGLKIAQRILDKRNELNGLRTLDQLYAVPMVGPERFTEIVTSLSGALPPRRPPEVTFDELAKLRRSIDALRAMLRPLPQTRLWSVQDTIWLGQSATLLAQINDAQGQPLRDQPLTITTSWGELESSSGTQTLVGNTVLTRTNDVGLAQLRLRPRFQAPLSDAQRLAFELAAARLPLSAPWPTAATAELADLVVRYRAHGSDALREAVDTAFREYGMGLQQADNRGEALAQWVQSPVSIVCYVHDDGDARGQQHLALATHTLLVRNWLPAFLATFETDSAADISLAKELQRAPRDATDAKAFLSDVFVTVQSFANAERGELGSAVRNRAAQAQLHEFLQTNVAALPATARLDALAGVGNAAKTLGDGGLTLFTAVDSNRRDSVTKFDANLGALDGRLGTLERSAVTTRQIEDFRAQIQQQTRTDVTAGVRDAQTLLGSQLRSQVADAETRLSQQLNLKADRASIDALTAASTTLRQDFDALSVNAQGLRGEVTGLSTSVNGLNSRITQDFSRLNTRVDGIDIRTRGGD